MREFLRQSRQNDLQKVKSPFSSRLLPFFLRQDFAMLPRLVANSWVSRDPPPHGAEIAGRPYWLLCPKRPLSHSLCSHSGASLERGWSLSLPLSSPVTGIKPKMSDPVTSSISGIFCLCLYDHTNQKDSHRSGLCSTLELLLCVLASERNGGIVECSASPHVHCGLSLISTLLWINRLDF